MNGIYAGTWDLLHPGHLAALRWAKGRCKFLTAALNIDPTIDNPKKQKPLESKADRIERLKACKFVDAIICYTGEKELKNIYRLGLYDVAFISEEHKENYTDPSPAKIMFVPRNSTHASTRLREAIYERR